MAEEPRTTRKLYPHPEFLHQLPRLGFLRASFEGGQSYLDSQDEHGQPVLVRLDRESEHNFKARKAIATVRNVCRPVVERTNAYIFGRSAAAQIKRSEDAELQRWQKDVDREGHSLQEFVSDCFRAAQVRGWSWAQFDAPPEDEETQEVEEGAAPPAPAAFGGLYLCHIDPERVVDWGYGADGRLQRFAVLEFSLEKASPWAEPKLRRFVRLWELRFSLTGDPEVSVGLVELDGESGYDVKAQARPPEGWPADRPAEEGILFLEFVLTSFEELPFVRCGYPGGCSQIEEVSHSQRRITNLKSWGDNELAKTFSTVVITGASDESVKQVTASATNLVCVGSPEAKVTVIGADAAQADSIRQEREFEEKEVARGTNLEASYRTTDTKAPESGEKKRRDLEALHQQLAAMAGAAEGFERELMRVLSRLAGREGTALADAVSYPADFDVKTVEELLLEIVELQGLPFVPDAFLRRRMREFITKSAGREKGLAELLLQVDAALPPTDQPRADLRTFMATEGIAGAVDLYMLVWPVPKELAAKAEKDADGRPMWNREDAAHRKWVVEFLTKAREESAAISPQPGFDESGAPLPPEALPPEGGPPGA